MVTANTSEADEVLTSMCGKASRMLTAEVDIVASGFFSARSVGLLPRAEFQRPKQQGTWMASEAGGSSRLQITLPACPPENLKEGMRRKNTYEGPE
jgi:hypothetical protein